MTEKEQNHEKNINSKVIGFLYITFILANIIGHIDNGVFSVAGE